MPFTQLSRYSFLSELRVKKRLETVLDRGRALLEDPFSPQDWAADTVAKQGKYHKKFDLRLIILIFSVLKTI